MGTNIFHSCFSISILVLVECVLQLNIILTTGKEKSSRNPCFSGMCFAIQKPTKSDTQMSMVATLVLVDSVLQ